MTAHINPASTQPALFNSPTLEFNAPPTRENLTAIARLGDVAASCSQDGTWRAVRARVRFSVRVRGIEKFKQSSRHRRETTRQVESTLELTMRVMGRDQAPIVMTERTIYNTLEIYRQFENQLFKLEVIRVNTYGKTERVVSLEDIRERAQYAAQSYAQNLEHCRTCAEKVVNSRIIVEGLVYALAPEPMYVTGLGDVLITTDQPYGLERPDLMASMFNALERDAAVAAMKKGISKRRNRKTGGQGAVIHVFDTRAVTRPSNQQNRQAVEDASVQKVLEQMRRILEPRNVTKAVKARVLDTLHGELEAERAKHQGRSTPHTDETVNADQTLCAARA
jgi:hypothetical protein